MIVGSPEQAFAAFWDPLDKLVYSKEKIAEIERHLKLYQPYPQEYIKAARAAMERFIRILEAEGVIVRRVESFDHTKSFSTPDWQTPGGFCAANLRDSFMVVGNRIIEAPMCSRSRFFEARAYRKLLNKYAKAGAQLISAGQPNNNLLIP
uniref:Amidase n=1 Tax=Candidatus Kentrum sp. LPFa TaxID=2126335 RepID=A0A450X7P7_9GAMM|nr:MAG: hypothetical protein BECKLPF1236B_GA0070989_14672 [Candidatus Kentron sp. LPFa]